MNELKTWEFENNKFYTVEIEGEPWFIGNQIAAILGYKYPKDAIRDNVDEDDKQLIEKTLLTNRENHEERNTLLGNYAGSGFNTTMTIINESGLYSLILKSQLPTAKKFKKWVTSEVLPAIRKQGGYLTNEKIEEVLNNPDTIIQLATNLKVEREKRKQAEEKSQTVKDEKEQKLFLQKQGGIPFQNGIHYYIRHTDNIHIHTHTQIFYR